MRLGVMGFLAAALLALLAASCEPGASRAGPGPAEPSAALAPPAGPALAPAAGERPPSVRPTERRGDRHARAAARKTPPVKRIAGTVARADARAVAIRAPGAPPVTLRVSPATTVTADGRPTRLEAVREGAEVRASYRTGGGRPTAIAIEVIEPEPAAPRGAAEGGEGGASWGTSAEPPPAGGG